MNTLEYAKMQAKVLGKFAGNCKEEDFCVFCGWLDYHKKGKYVHGKDCLLLKAMEETGKKIRKERKKRFFNLIMMG